jgi:hypothetical protein
MHYVEFATIYTSFNDLKVVQEILPGIVEECRRTQTALIVHDCSTNASEETWSWYRQQGEQHDFFYLFSRRMQFAIARNMCLQLAIEMYSPQYICMLEDDHGYRPGAIDALRKQMQSTYGRKAPNGLRYGLYSICPNCWGADFRRTCTDDGNGNLTPGAHNQPWQLGGANSCVRCAPVSHWQSVLKGYDPDEYPISFWQTKNLNLRNYNRGFTAQYVGGGDLVQRKDRPGTGVGMVNVRFDETYTASDSRSRVPSK